MTVALQQSIGPFGQDQLIFGIIVLAMSALGLWLIYTGITNLKRGYDFWSHDPIDAGSLHIEEGVVEVQGTAEPIDEVAAAEYSDTDCFAYTYEMKEKRRRHDTDGMCLEWLWTPLNP